MVAAACSAHLGPLEVNRVVRPPGMSVNAVSGRSSRSVGGVLLPVPPANHRLTTALADAERPVLPSRARRPAARAGAAPPVLLHPRFRHSGAEASVLDVAIILPW